MRARDPAHLSETGEGHGRQTPAGLLVEFNFDPDATEARNEPVSGGRVEEARQVEDSGSGGRA